MDHSSVQATCDKLPTVLYVDDEPLAQKYFKSSIGRHANVLTASNPIEAWEVLAAHGRAVSVVVSDERMPYESGVPFLRDMGKRWPSTIRVLTSAYADVDKLQQAINDASIHRFVPKPWDMDQLCHVVCESLLAQWDGEKVGLVRHDEGSEDQSTHVADFTQALIKPLRTLEAEALKLVGLTGQSSIAPMGDKQSQIGNWASHHALGQFSSAAARVHKQAVNCLSMAEAIADMAKKPHRLQ